jgi:hypothetical protein
MVRAAKIMVVLGLLVLCGSAWAVEPNLVSHWKFDDGSGTTAYDSAGDNNGTIYGATWTTGPIDGALSFDGVGDYVVIADDDSLTPSAGLTISAWIYINAVSWSDRTAIVCKYAYWSPDRSYTLELGKGSNPDKSSVCLTVSATTNPFTGKITCGTTQLQAGQWYHVVGTFEPNHQEIYINGTEETDDTAAKIADSIANNSEPLYIGYNKTEDDYFNGVIDDVRIYDRALSAEEIWQLYQAAPVACVVGGDQAIEAGSGCEARVTLDGSCSSDADSTPGTNDDINDFDWYLVDACDPNFEDFLGSGEIIECNLPLGEHDIILEVTDKAGAFDTNEVTIIVEDTTPPEFSLTATPDVLWPANHKMVKITPSWEVSDNCDEWPEVSLVSITVDGDGATEDDIQIGDEGIWLRAERSGRGIGRVYTISYQAADDSGNVTVNSTTVTVPHDRRRR